MSERRARTLEEAREALQRLINGVYHRPTSRPCFTIPVDEQHDADCILGDVIAELEDLRARIAHLKRLPTRWAIACLLFTSRAFCERWEVTAQEQFAAAPVDTQKYFLRKADDVLRLLASITAVQGMDRRH